MSEKREKARMLAIQYFAQAAADIASGYPSLAEIDAKIAIKALAEYLAAPAPVLQAAE